MQAPPLLGQSEVHSLKKSLPTPPRLMDRGPMRVAVVTVNYCCAEEIIRNLEPTARQIASARGFWFIVDNCSPDDSARSLRTAIEGVENVTLIEAGRNGGFGYGNNRVIERVIGGQIDADYVYLLNPDALPCTGSIALMASYLDDNAEVGIVGSALVDPDGNPTASMFRFPSLLSEVESALAIGPVSRLLARFRTTLPPLSAAGPVDWVSGASMMIRADVLRSIGGFDEDFFLYWEEVELCHRVRKSGFEVHGLPEARVLHIGGVSTGVRGQSRLPGYWHQSRNTYFRKTGARSLLFLNMVTAVSLAVGRCWQWLRGKPGKPPRFLRDHLKHALTSTSINK